jgi:hypothetical protein
MQACCCYTCKTCYLNLYLTEQQVCIRGIKLSLCTHGCMPVCTSSGITTAVMFSNRWPLSSTLAHLHLRHDVTPAQQLPLDIQLRVGGPVTVHLDPRPERLILEDVNRLEGDLGDNRQVLLLR